MKLQETEKKCEGFGEERKIIAEEMIRKKAIRAIVEKSPPLNMAKMEGKRKGENPGGKSLFTKKGNNKITLCLRNYVKNCSYFENKMQSMESPQPTFDASYYRIIG